MTSVNMRGWRWMAAGACALALGAGIAAQQKVLITGAGATFPQPIYEKWFSEYNKLHPQIQINYQPLGSGAGIRNLTQQTVFFGATDGPMTQDQMLAAPARILHLPTVLGAVVPIYNVPGVTAEIKFTGTVLADIFLEKIKKWNDPAIAAANPGVTLPNVDILTVHRSDSSGTTYIWCDFLGKVSPEWLKRVGVNTAVNWPGGIGGAKSDGVTAAVKQTPGAIGYVELVFALQNKLAYGQVQSADKEFVKATIESTTAAAAAAAAKMPADFRVSIVNAPGKGAYPVSSFTWMLFYEAPSDKAKAKVMVEFMQWALTDGQKFAAAIGYAPLPPAVITLELEALKKIKTQ